MVEFPDIPGDMTPSARARWLAELAAALDAAQAMLAHLGRPHSSPEAMELNVRIEAARLEVLALRLRARRMPAEIDPQRSQQLPWERFGTDC